MKTVQYLEAAKVKLGISSDYALAQHLNITASAVSRYRKRGTTFDPMTASKIAEILEINPMRVIADAELERAAGKPEQREYWKRIAQKIAAVLVAAGVGGLVNIAGVRPAYAAAGGFDISKSAPSLAHERAVIAIGGLRRWLRSLFALPALGVRP